MLVMRSGSKCQVDDDGEDDDRHAPVGSDVIVRPQQPQEQRTGDQAEEAEIDDVPEVAAAGLAGQGVGVDLDEHVERLRADEQALAGDAVHAADSRSQNLDFGQVVRVRLGWVLGNLDGIPEGDHRSLLGVSGRKIAAKYWSCGPAHCNGPRRVLPPLTFLAARRSTLSPA